MPRPKKVGGPEPKKRSRTGCWPCKARKVKCDELRPICANCQKQGEACDYSIRLQWEGRPKKKSIVGELLMGSGEIDFSTSSISLGLRTSSFVGALGTPTSSSTLQNPSPVSPLPPDTPLFLQNEQTEQHVQGQPPRQDVSIAEAGPPRSLQSVSHTGHEATTIDPVLVENAPVVSMVSDSYSFNPIMQSDTHYTESYIRYRPHRPATFATPSDSSSHFFTTTSTTSLFGNRKDDSNDSEFEISHNQPAKRRRFYYSQDRETWPHARMPPPDMASSNGQPQTPFSQARSSSSANTPSTPTSAYSDDGMYPSKLSPQVPQEQSDLRRLSVNSLLSGPPGIPPHNCHIPRSNPEDQDWSIQVQDLYQDTKRWGFDCGSKDLDIPHNDDANAISKFPPLVSTDQNDFTFPYNVGASPVEFGFGMETDSTAFETGGYYDKPVPMYIPKMLEPLPAKLLENEMNLLYFHHFLNHTARCLIPHNCSSNPFRSILPQIAVQDDNLLNLLLAYSASHRARLLRQPEPANRIAFWVQDIFPNLRRALDDPSARISDANLATAIMLASLEIISPKAFGVAVPWQQHLGTARQMISARGGPHRMQTTSRKDKVSSFLWSWFAYLDVLGSLSGGKANAASSSWILDYDIDANDDYQIDCILGFTSKCVRLLAKIAELARICDHERIGQNHEISTKWEPSEENVHRAAKLEADLSESRQHPAKACTHMQSTDEAAFHWDTIEMAATNEAFHWAGLVHLHRRILGKPSTHPDVQNAVREIFGALYKVRRGSSAEACLLFPMFTAGCDTEDEKQRTDILERIKGVERFGMTQVHKARTLMERVWETGKPWETLVAGEFFG